MVSNKNLLDYSAQGQGWRAEDKIIWARPDTSQAHTLYYIVILLLIVLRSHLWEEENILDGWRVGHEHCQAVNSHTES